VVSIFSSISPSSWEYPPAVCGHHADVVSLEHSKRWSMASYHIFSHMAADPVLATKYGVRMRQATFFFPFKVTDDEAQRKKMREIQRSGVAGFRHDANIIKEVGLADEEKWQDAYEHLSPVVDTDRALIAIEKLVKVKGANFVQERIDGDLIDLESELRARFNAGAIVNATGLGAATTASDNMYPLRGAVLRVLNDGTRFEKLERALIVSATAEGKETSE
jgi:D-amino-acid oxidase